MAVVQDLRGRGKKAGHRIRVEISNSNFPRFDVNPNTGERFGQHTHTVVAHNMVCLDGDCPSHIVLPIICAKHKKGNENDF